MNLSIERGWQKTVFPQIASYLNSPAVLEHGTSSIRLSEPLASSIFEVIAKEAEEIHDRYTPKTIKPSKSSSVATNVWYSFAPLMVSIAGINLLTPDRAIGNMPIPRTPENITVNDLSKILDTDRSGRTLINQIAHEPRWVQARMINWSVSYNRVIDRLVKMGAERYIRYLELLF